MTTNTKTATVTDTATVTKGILQLGDIPACLARMKASKGAAGKLPTAAELSAATHFVKRPGTKKHFGAAMMLRDGGATQPEITIATGDTQVNVWREAKQMKVGDAGKGERRGGVETYTLALTKPKPKRKASAKRKATAKNKPTSPASETVTG